VFSRFRKQLLYQFNIIHVLIPETQKQNNLGSWYGVAKQTKERLINFMQMSLSWDANSRKASQEIPQSSLVRAQKPANEPCQESDESSWKKLLLMLSTHQGLGIPSGYIWKPTTK